MTAPTLSKFVARLATLGWAVATLAGCNLIRNYGTGTHLDEARERPKNNHAAKAATIQAEVTTDADAQVVSITFVRSSGSGGVDGYVADSIRHNWPGSPSTRSLVEIVYTPGSGFTNPKVLSSSPVTP